MMELHELLDGRREGGTQVEVGDTVRVHVRVVEGGKERVQVFEGTVMRMRGGGLNQTITVRRVSSGVGVERTFPLHSPRVERIQVMKSGHVRRAKLYYLRERSGRAARLREKRTVQTPQA